MNGSLLRGIGRRSYGIVCVAAVLAAAPGVAAAAEGSPLRPDPSPASGTPGAPGIPGPDTNGRATTPVQTAAPKTTLKTTPKTVPTRAAAPTRAVVPASTVTVPRTSTPVVRTTPPRVHHTPARTHPTKPVPAQSHRRVVPFGVRFALAGTNATVAEAKLALPAALAFLALVTASGGFVGFVYRMRRELREA